MEYRLMFLGRPRLERAGREVSFPYRRATALLAWLAVEGEQPRRHLAALLWPDSAPGQGAASLRQALHLVRTRLPGLLLDARPQTIALAPAATDLAQAEAATDPEEALRAVRGGFLQGLDLAGCETFEDWLAVQRHRWEAFHLSALVRAGEARLAAGQTGGAREAAERALLLDPYHERARRLLRKAWSPRCGGSSPP